MKLYHKLEASYQDPDIPERTKVGISHGPLLAIWQGSNELNIGRRMVAIEKTGGLGTQQRSHGGGTSRHRILENDAPNNNRYGCGYRAKETHSGDHGGCIADRDSGLRGEEWRLKVQAGADSGEDLKGKEPLQRRLGP